MRKFAAAVSITMLLLAGCGKVSRDFKHAGDEVKDALLDMRDARITTESEAEKRKDEIKRKLEVVTAATKSDRERDAQAVLVNTYVQISLLKAAEMLQETDAAQREVERVKTKANQCLEEYAVLVGDKSGNENGPCLQEAKAANAR